MIKYGSDSSEELRFLSFEPKLELRADQWVDIELRFTIEQPDRLPADLIDCTILVITNLEGRVAQMAVLDEGCDTDYQLAPGEKVQLAAYIDSHDIQQKISNLVNQS